MQGPYFLKISALGFLLSCWALQAQSMDALQSCYAWDEQEVLPEDIFSERVVCWVSLEGEDHDLWTNFAAEAQAYFQKLGLDVVAYAPLSELYIGEEVRSIQLRQLYQRGIRYLTFLSQRTDHQRVELLIVPLDEQEHIAPRAEVWRFTAPKLKQIYEQIEDQKSRYRIPQNNWLVTEAVEQMRPVHISNHKHIKRLPFALDHFLLEVKLRTFGGGDCFG